MTRLHLLSEGDLRPGIFTVDSSLNESSIEQATSSTGFLFYILDGRVVTTKGEFLRVAAGTFGFPDYFGHNWDAFADSVLDFTWLDRRPEGIVVLWRGADVLANAEPSEFAKAIEILDWAIDTWWARSVRFYVLLEANPPLEQTSLLPSFTH